MFSVAKYMFNDAEQKKALGVRNLVYGAKESFPQTKKMSDGSRTPFFL